MQVVDCIEFNDWFHFRYLDIGYDIAFLAMDLEARGHADLGDAFAGRYLAASGDETLGVLQPLHRAFRAFVRGKVESIGANAPEVPTAERQRLADSAARYFRLAADYAGRRRGAGPRADGRAARHAASRQSAGCWPAAPAPPTSPPTPCASDSPASTRARTSRSSTARASTAPR